MKKGEWLSGKDLMNRWGLRPFELIDYIRHSMTSDPLEEKLLPCTPATKRPFEISLLSNTFRGFNNEGFYFPNKPYLIRDWGELLPYVAECIFILWRVEAFEKKHTELLAETVAKPQVKESEKKLRPVQKHRIECRKVAKELWKKNQNMTISDVTYSDELNNVLDGKTYTESTIRNWIKDLCPNRSPGRRPKEK